MTAGEPSRQISTYLHYLPAIFQQEVDETFETTAAQSQAPPVSKHFINGLLLAFEQILRGRSIANAPGIEEFIDRMYAYFEPEKLDAKGRAQLHTPAEFLPWLASWVALSLRNDWTEDERRRFIARTVPLYRKRGTRDGLIEALQTYVTALASATGAEGNQTGEQRDTISVEDYIRPMQIGTICTLGVDTWIDGAPPNYFIVILHLAKADPARFTELFQDRRIIALIDQYKPAHTYYDLYLSAPTIRLNADEPSVVGKSTYLMSAPIRRG